MSIHVARLRARTVLAAVIAGASSTAVLAIGAGPADAAYTAQIQGQTLQIVGNAASDKLAVGLDSSNPGLLDLDVGEDGTTDFAFDRAAISAINVQAGGGDDDVAVTQGITIPTTIDGGAGDDTLSGGSGDDAISGGPGNDTIDGNRGNDTLLGGTGRDTFTWDPGEGSDSVDGQGGADALEFHGSNIGERINLSPNGSHVSLTRDVAAISMDLNGIETVDLSTIGGADTVTAGDLAGTDVSKVNVDLSGIRGSGTGDGSADTVVAAGTDSADDARISSAAGAVLVSGLGAQLAVTGGDPAMDDVDVATGNGDDTVRGGIGVAGSVPVTVDGGSGQDSMMYAGTSGPDSIVVSSLGTAAAVDAPGTGTVTQSVTPAVESLDVEGLAGDDTIAGSNGLAALTGLTIDGGPGDDALIGGDGADVIDGGSGADTVTGARGNDLVALGSGRDTFTWNPGDGSDTVDGQQGHDLVDFNGSNVGEDIDLSAQGPRVRLFRNVGAVTMDMGGIEALDLTARGGADEITVGDLTGTSLKQAALDLAGTPGTGTGDGAADALFEDGTPGPDHVKVTRSGDQVLTTGLQPRLAISGTDPALDALEIETQGGHDVASVAPDVSQLINSVVDLGADQ